ncbi:hypothetical protein MPH_08821 [Macrophomina phaseolina MS6]|uniref:Uncharacterized protein n=1 Tax=Macrophomina phaseolina (strain MS6) TaxID=1126212 RepID=K2RHL3_MACPH|nr:hypothetical protein MPH_08821 [Macrophomina phaseolina MS6]
MPADPGGSGAPAGSKEAENFNMIAPSPPAGLSANRTAVKESQNAVDAPHDVSHTAKSIPASKSTSPAFIAPAPNTDHLLKSVAVNYSVPKADTRIRPILGGYGAAFNPFGLPQPTYTVAQFSSLGHAPYHPNAMSALQPDDVASPLFVPSERHALGSTLPQKPSSAARQPSAGKDISNTKTSDSAAQAQADSASGHIKAAHVLKGPPKGGHREKLVRFVTTAEQLNTPTGPVHDEIGESERTACREISATAKDITSLSNVSPNMSTAKEFPKQPASATKSNPASQSSPKPNFFGVKAAYTSNKSPRNTPSKTASTTVMTRKDNASPQMQTAASRVPVAPMHSATTVRTQKATKKTIAPATSSMPTRTKHTVAASALSKAASNTALGPPKKKLKKTIDTRTARQKRKDGDAGAAAALRRNGPFLSDSSSEDGDDISKHTPQGSKASNGDGAPTQTAPTDEAGESAKGKKRLGGLLFSSP